MDTMGSINPTKEILLPSKTTNKVDILIQSLSRDLQYAVTVGQHKPPKQVLLAYLPNGPFQHKHECTRCTAILSKRYQDAGLREICLESGLVVQGSLSIIWFAEGKAFSRAVRVH